MTLLVKAVKPKKLKKDVFRLEFLSGLRDIERDIIREFKKTTQTWKGEKPDFEGVRSLRGGKVTLLVGPVGDTEGVQKWVWLDEGTKDSDKPIVPKNARFLRFRNTYTAKTTPGVFGSRSGGASGDYVFRRYVIHKGIKPRGWTAKAAKMFLPRYKRRMEQAMRRAKRKSNQEV